MTRTAWGSTAALTPKDEIEGDMGAMHVGKQARLMSQALRKLTAIVAKSKTVVIFLNQIRMQIGVMFGNPETKIEGMVRLKDIDGDFYELDEKNYCIVGQRTKKKFSLGDKVKVKLTASDLDRKTLDFKLI
jgi:RecA/RadA recombinase